MTRNLLAAQRDRLIREIRDFEEGFARHFTWIYGHLRQGDEKDSAVGKVLSSAFSPIYDKMTESLEPAMLNSLMLSLAHFGCYGIFLNLQAAVDLETLENAYCKIRWSEGVDDILKSFNQESCQHVVSAEDAINFHRRLILCKLKVEPVLECLEANQIFNGNVLDKIKTQPSRTSKINQLLDFLISNGYSGYFCDLLIQSGQFDLFAFVAGSLFSDDIKALENNVASRKMALSAFWNDIENISPYCDIKPSTSTSEPSGFLEINVDQADADTELRLYRCNKAHVYKNFSSPKGLCLVINNREFAVHPHRSGTDVDEENITKLFSKLGYRVETYRNLTGSQLISAAKQFSQRSEHQRAHSTVVVVLTHGEYDQLIGVDGNYVRLHEEFLYYFSATMAPNLAGKPKLFFIQACRGHDNDPGRRVSLPADYQDGKNKLRSKTDGILSSLAKQLNLRPSTPTSPEVPSMKLPASLIKPKKSLKVQGITAPTTFANTAFATPLIETKMPIMADFLVAYSTGPGFVSWRNSINGTWFIQSICEIFSKEAARDDILDLLTKVNRQVAKVYESSGEGFKQIPEFSSRLQRKFYFYPGVVSDE
ncbi:unnamed protein product [Bursaphelenchus xylophilus]|uniref:(pine wood nematode) hypothetical protein n=1 Tax=Bursaphelenchus xylophilus TaxID=6326 RepID=A0A1I7SVH3_BURXY|nr:unnamed protein product [Bursaphelenchus xylophilus]CAG9101456.1 unnamed protein product [Bursaphelenchus xylophilus]